MEEGGYRLLLKFLLEWDLNKANVNIAPETIGLLDQKIESLNPLRQWWLSCLTEGEIVGSDFEGGWPHFVDKERFQSAFGRYLKKRQIRTWVQNDRVFAKQLNECNPGMVRARKRQDQTRVRGFLIPPLDHSRANWNEFIGHSMDWEVDFEIG